MRIKRNFFLIVVFVLSMQMSYAQDSIPPSTEVQTLLADSNGYVFHGAFGGITIGYGTIDKEASLFLGGRVAWLINHKFALGFAGAGFFNNLIKDDTYLPSDYYLKGGYGGLFFQPIFFSKEPIHFSFPILLGVGGVVVDHNYYWTQEWGATDANYYDSDVFLIFEPGIDVEFNMISFMRMSLGASYRFTNNVNLMYEYNEDGVTRQHDIDTHILNNFSFRLGIFFGWF